MYEIDCERERRRKKISCLGDSHGLLPSPPIPYSCEYSAQFHDKFNTDFSWARVSTCIWPDDIIMKVVYSNVLELGALGQVALESIRHHHATVVRVAARMGSPVLESNTHSPRPARCSLCAYFRTHTVAIRANRRESMVVANGWKKWKTAHKVNKRE